MTREERMKKLRIEGYTTRCAKRKMDHEDLIKDISDLPISREFTNLLKRIVDFSK